MTINIITVCFNSEKTIEKTLISVLKQQSKNIRYIIIDGASTDKTINIIQSYRYLFINEKKEFIYLSEPDSGIYEAMNKGIKLVKDGIITFLNSDDWLDDNFTKYINNLNITKAGIYFGNVTCIDDTRKSFIAKPRFPLWRMKDQMCIFHPGTCVSLKVFESIGVFDINFKLSADYDFFLRAFLAKTYFKYIDKNLVFFTLSGLSKKLRKKGLKENQIIRKKNKIFFRHFFNFKEKYLSPIFYKIRHELFLGKK